MKKYDIIIIGAGPAGCSSALTLKDSKLKIALIEKDEFPRQKICGDGICDRSINTLRKISETYYTELLNKKNPQAIQKTSIVYKGKHHVLQFKNFGFTMPRFEFDNFLFSLVKRDCTNIDIFQNTNIVDSTKTEKGIILETADKEEFYAPIVIIGNGAKSKLASELSGISWDKMKNGIAIRAYYEGVTGMQADTIELHYKKEYFPGYLWIFPMHDGIANVGFGYHLRDAEKYQNKIQDVFESWLRDDEDLKLRFANAKQTSKLQGGLIPYNTNEFYCAGNNYMITGDAASLIDPISGGGIGSAMFSGHIAALQAQQCCITNDFSITQTKLYEQALKNRIQKEIKTRHNLQKRISKSPWVLDILAQIAKSANLLQKISNWYLK